VFQAAHDPHRHPGAPRLTTPRELIRRMCEHFGVEEDDVRSGCSLARPLRVRKMAVYVLRMDRGLTFGEIARVLNADRGAVHRLYFKASRQPDPAVTVFLGQN
jgi:chromosomal replication initiation ATPase DnaA